MFKAKFARAENQERSDLVLKKGSSDVHVGRLSTIKRLKSPSNNMLPLYGVQPCLLHQVLLHCTNMEKSVNATSIMAWQAAAH